MRETARHMMERRGFLQLAAGGVAVAAIGGAGWSREVASVARGTDCKAIPGVSPKREFRAAWVATVENTDWPSETGLSAERQRREFVRLMDEAAAMNLNAVVVQVRAAADAFYPSRYAPWSEYLTGTPGESPGYDPLAFMVHAAHERNIEFHAWFNPYRVSLQSDRRRLAPDSPARRHPEWVVEYGGQLYFDPGIPGARRLIETSILEAVENYDLDAVHFDDYFYPYPVAGEPFPDADTFRENGGKFGSRADWRRYNVNRLVRDLSERIKRAKPWVKFGVSPFAVWRNKDTDPTGSDTQASIQTYDDLYADTRKWIQRGWVDYVAPQIYWNIGFEPAAYDILVPWWSREVAGTETHLYAGQAAYKIGADNAAWDDPREMPSHVRYNRRRPQVRGDVYFSISSLLANPLGFRDRLENRLYEHEALIPVMPWMARASLRPPKLRSARRTARGVELRWSDASFGNGSAYFVVYRFGGRRDRHACAFEDSRRILTTVRMDGNRAVQSFTDTTARAGREYTYYVTALDRLHHESQPSNGRFAAGG